MDRNVVFDGTGWLPCGADGRSPIRTIGDEVRSIQYDMERLLHDFIYQPRNMTTNDEMKHRIIQYLSDKVQRDIVDDFRVEPVEGPNSFSRMMQITLKL